MVGIPQSFQRPGAQPPDLGSAFGGLVQGAGSVLGGLGQLINGNQGPGQGADIGNQQQFAQYLVQQMGKGGKVDLSSLSPQQKAAIAQLIANDPNASPEIKQLAQQALAANAASSSAPSTGQAALNGMGSFLDQNAQPGSPRWQALHANDGATPPAASGGAAPTPAAPTPSAGVGPASSTGTSWQPQAPGQPAPNTTPPGSSPANTPVPPANASIPSPAPGSSASAPAAATPGASGTDAKSSAADTSNANKQPDNGSPAPGGSGDPSAEVNQIRFGWRPGDTTGEFVGRAFSQGTQAAGADTNIATNPMANSPYLRWLADEYRPQIGANAYAQGIVGQGNQNLDQNVQALSQSVASGRGAGSPDLAAVQAAIDAHNAAAGGASSGLSPSQDAFIANMESDPQHAMENNILLSAAISKYGNVAGAVMQQKLTNFEQQYEANPMAFGGGSPASPNPTSAYFDAARKYLNI
jgi:hypothetical protein